MSASLTETQMEILKTLVELYEKKKRMIKSKEVAQHLGKDEGTVRNIIMWLRGMNLVESRTGPSGGYRPTLKAYELLERGTLGAEYGYGEAVFSTPGGTIRIPIYRLELVNVLSAESILALVKTGSPINIDVDTQVTIRSKPVERIIIEGRVRQVNREAGEFLVRVDKLVVIPDARVGDIARRKLITLKADMSIKEAAKVLSSHGIRGAPVLDEKGRTVGFLTTTDIARLVANGIGVDEPIRKYMRQHVFTIAESDSIIEAMRLMDFHSVGRLVVLDSRGRVVGIITRTDILRYIVSLQRPTSKTI